MFDDLMEGNVTISVLGPETPTPYETAAWLIEHRREMDSTEATWLAVLGDFEASAGFVIDGQWSLANWLTLRCGMARSTAFEKAQVAAELRRRPWLMAALAGGEASYSAIRRICRVNVFDADLDRSFLDAYAQRGMADLERVVRHWELTHGGANPPDPSRPGYRMGHGPEGIGRAVLDAPNELLDEIETAIDAFAPPVDQDNGLTAAQRRLEGLMNLVRAAKPHARNGGAMGDDEFMVHVIADLDRLMGGTGRSELADGTPIAQSTLELILCDCSIVAHLTRHGIDPLFLGRKTHVWSRAQRRAINARDRSRCRVPGCESTHTDIHHLRHWVKGGPTDVTNGALLCRFHHSLHHAGKILISGDANGELVFCRPDGELIGATRPLGDPSRLFG